MFEKIKHCVRLTHFLLVGFIVVGCSESQPLPENNEFSYLDPESTKKPIELKDETVESSVVTLDSSKTFTCSQPSTDVVGILNRVEYFGPPGYGKTPSKDQTLNGLVLKLSKNIEVTCDNQTTIKCKDILLEVSSDVTYEHLMGGTVVARGQLLANDPKFTNLPVKMNVLRLESLKPVLQ